MASHRLALARSFVKGLAKKNENERAAWHIELVRDVGMHPEPFRTLYMSLYDVKELLAQEGAKRSCEITERIDAMVEKEENVDEAAKRARSGPARAGGGQGREVAGITMEWLMSQVEKLIDIERREEFEHYEWAKELLELRELLSGEPKHRSLIEDLWNWRSLRNEHNNDFMVKVKNMYEALNQFLEDLDINAEGVRAPAGQVITITHELNVTHEDAGDDR